MYISKQIQQQKLYVLGKAKSTTAAETTTTTAAAAEAAEAAATNLFLVEQPLSFDSSPDTIVPRGSFGYKAIDKQTKIQRYEKGETLLQRRIFPILTEWLCKNVQC